MSAAKINMNDQVAVLQFELDTSKAISQQVIQRLQNEVNWLTAELAKAKKEIEDDARYIASSWEYSPRRGVEGDEIPGNL